MNYSKQLAERLAEVLLSGQWVANTNYWEQLHDIDWNLATKRPPGGNSIALLAQHIHYYIAGVKQVLNGGPLDIRDKYSFDFPKITSQMQWRSFLDTFRSDAEGLVQLVADLPDEVMEQVFVDEKYGTYRRNLNGMIEHCYYHLGQIVFLKKQLEQTG